MKDIEKRINEAFPKALLHMEEEDAFFEAYVKRILAEERLEEAKIGLDMLCSDIAFEALDAEDEYVAKRLANAKSDVSIAECDFQVALSEQKAAMEKLQAIPEDVLQAKVKLNKARWYLSKVEYMKYNREFFLAAPFQIIGDEEAIHNMSEAYTLKNAAKDEMKRAEVRFRMFDDFGRG